MTSDHAVLRLFHGSAIVGDVLEAGRFHHQFFGSWVFDAQHLDAEQARTSTNLMGGDFCIELIAPVEPAVDTGASRFLERHGPHVNNLAFWTRDCGGLAQHLLDQGIRVAVRGRGFASVLPSGESFDYVLTHPKDTHGLALEFLEDQQVHDPRHRPWWDSSFWRERHPLGVRGLSHATFVVADRDAAAHVLADVMGCNPVLSEAATDLGAVTRSDSAWFTLGDSVLEISTPNGQPSVRADHLREHGSMLYSFTFVVSDLDAVLAHARSLGVDATRCGDHLVELLPSHTSGLVYAFTDTPARIDSVGGISS